MSYGERHIYRDGRVVLYTRNGKPTYHARLRIPGKPGYITHSTHQTSLYEARKVADQRFDDLSYKHRHGLLVETVTFAQAWKRFLEEDVAYRSVHRRSYIGGTGERYFLRFFGPRTMESINSRVVSDYWTWRINFWKSPEGQERLEQAGRGRYSSKNPKRSKLSNVVRKPSYPTLRHEQGALHQFWVWAKEKEIVRDIPTIKPEKGKARAGERRPAFTLEEWKQLRVALDKWSEPDGEANGYVTYHKELFKNYVIFMASSGLRPNEARQLEWRDISEHVDADGNEYLVIHVRTETKTGERDVIPLAEAQEVLYRLSYLNIEGAYGPKIDKGEESFRRYVFGDRHDKPVKTFGKTFKRFLKANGLLCDSRDRERVVYSLRHTHATFRLLHSAVSMHDLAQNLGTSPNMIHRHYSHITTRQRAKVHIGSLVPE